MQIPFPSLLFTLNLIEEFGHEQLHTKYRLLYIDKYQCAVSDLESTDYINQHFSIDETIILILKSYQKQT